jgi:superfamily II DNA or RNA helicase
MTPETNAANMPSQEDYRELLDRKAIRVDAVGITRPQADLAEHLFAYQRECVSFLLSIGRGGLFLDTGLGKTACELEWSRHAADATNGRALILTPLAVAAQIAREAQRWGYDARVIRDKSESRDGIDICNYDRLDKLDPGSYGSVVLDESSILKSFAGKTSRALIEVFRSTRFRMSSTATPAPNDHMELGQHSSFCGILAASEMLSRFFINDSSTASQHWRLKGHALIAFWDWMASWSRMASMPSDLGDSDEGFQLPQLRNFHHGIRSLVKAVPGSLFAAEQVSATGMHALKRQTSKDRAECASEIVAAEADQAWVIWCDTDYEADALGRALSDFRAVAEVRGSHSIDRKESTLQAFVEGETRILITKPSVCGFGLNWQHCARTIFVGRSFSYEKWYQAVRRLWRFGQKRPVDCHVIVAAGEEAIGRVIDRKAEGHADMKREMAKAMRRAISTSSEKSRVAYRAGHKGRMPAWL